MADRRHLPSPVSLIRRRPRRRPSQGPAVEAAQPAAESRSALVDSAVYADGCRQCSPTSLAETFTALREQPGGMAWIGLYRPGSAELSTVAAEFDLHPLAIEDAITAHQRP